MTLLCAGADVGHEHGGGRTMGHHAQSDADRSAWAGGPRAGDERFVGSGVLYATGGGHGPDVSRQAAAGLGGAAALGTVQVMGWLFPYSPMLF